MPRVRAASASAPPWLPDEWVTTPRAAAASSSDHTALQAPRNLNAPARCSGSALKCSEQPAMARSEEHTSELQSLMRTSYAVFCLKKNTKNEHHREQVSARSTVML